MALARDKTADEDKGSAIVWFRRDLRLADHAALRAAAQGGRPIVAVYVLDDAAAGDWAWGGASRWWLHHSLISLRDSLAKKHVTLTLRRGSAAKILPALLKETGATTIHAGLMHEPWARAQEDAVAKALPDDALKLHRTATMHPIDAVRTKTGGIYGVYTPYANAIRSRGDPAPPEPAPATLHAAPAPDSDDINDWKLLPQKPDWAAGFRETWAPGEAGAHAWLRAFVEKPLPGYDVGRNIPGVTGTSMLSPHLHWGELSPNQVWHEAAAVKQGGKGLPIYLSELIWREFAAYMLWHNPHLPEQPLRPRFSALPTRKAKADLRAWQQGRTGVPIVDAGMRQLWNIGWMHNRVRMITASFLIKHLLLPWQEGEAWFWDSLVDADLASNATNWQWVAGTGIDSQPFFRVFNPVTQGEKFDPDGAYVRRWVPEVKNLPDRYVHAPWTAPAVVLAGAGLRLGEGYPRPVIDLAEGRDRALAAYRDAVRDKSEPDAGSQSES